MKRPDYKNLHKLPGDEGWQILEAWDEYKKTDEYRNALIEKCRLRRERILPESKLLAPLIRKAMKKCPDDYMEVTQYSVSKKDKNTGYLTRVWRRDPIEYLLELRSKFNIKYNFDWDNPNGESTAYSVLGDPYNCDWIYEIFYEADRKTPNKLGKRFMLWFENHRFSDEEDDE